MKDDESTTTLRQPTQVREAEGKLSILLGVPADQAALGLDLSAQFRGISVDEAAAQLLDGRAEIGDRQLAILRQHLDSAGSPLDQSR